MLYIKHYSLNQKSLIRAAQYQLQQPSTDTWALRGLVTLPYLIWRGGERRLGILAASQLSSNYRATQSQPGT